MAIVLFDSTSTSPAGNSYSNAQQLTRLGTISVVLSSEGNAIGSGSLAGYLLPTTAEEGDIVEIYSTDNTAFYIYANSVPVNNSTNNLATGNIPHVRLRYVGSAWFGY
jgi:hypothetical protein